MRTKKFLSLLLSAAMAFSLLTATAFAAAPAEEENGFFDFLLGKKYTYLYAALTWDEYWANEKVYAAGSTAASAQLDSHEEQDLGAFDAVSRATVNHGLHRGSFQSTAVIYAKDGSSYTVSHWSDDGKTIYLADGTTVGWNRGGQKHQRPEVRSQERRRLHLLRRTHRLRLRRGRSRPEGC